MIKTLERRGFPVDELRPLGVADVAGTPVRFAGREFRCLEATEANFEGLDIAIFSAGAEASLDLAPKAVRQGAVVIDNSSAWRMDPACPLVVPEVNPHDLAWHTGIIANPNCSTIQMVVVLKPLHDLWSIKRVVVSTYQSVTGAGKKGLTQLEEEIAGRDGGEKKFPHQIAFNVLPQVDVFLEDGSTREEYKMVDETRKIMGEPGMAVTATCVRVPVWGGHSEAVNVEFHRPCEAGAAIEALRKAPGVIVQDNPQTSEYPMPVNAWDRDEVFVGRIRRDASVANGLNLWVVSDNLRKGAATNAVQIAEEWIKGH
jgi:aspartate-semialdehyde dehydrogenase